MTAPDLTGYEAAVAAVAEALEQVVIDDLGPDAAFPMEDYARAAITALTALPLPVPTGLATVIYTAWTGQDHWGGCDQREAVERTVDAVLAAYRALPPVATAAGLLANPAATQPQASAIGGLRQRVARLVRDHDLTATSNGALFADRLDDLLRAVLGGDE